MRPSRSSVERDARVARDVPRSPTRTTAWAPVAQDRRAAGSASATTAWRRRSPTLPPQPKRAFTTQRSRSSMSFATVASSPPIENAVGRRLLQHRRRRRVERPSVARSACALALSTTCALSFSQSSRPGHALMPSTRPSRKARATARVFASSLSTAAATSVHRVGDVEVAPHRVRVRVVAAAALDQRHLAVAHAQRAPELEVAEADEVVRPRRRSGARCARRCAAPRCRSPCARSRCR